MITVTLKRFLHVCQLQQPEHSENPEKTAADAKGPLELVKKFDHQLTENRFSLYRTKKTRTTTTKQTKELLNRKLLIPVATTE